jgi:hypothetical protein
MSNQELYNQRLRRVADAVALKEPDRVPVTLMASGLPYFLYHATHTDALYGYQKAAEVFIKYYEEFPINDIASGPQFMSGKANEIAESGMIDWPGKPGTIVPEHTTYQVIEQEYLLQEEYDDLIKDYSGFMINKYLPRAYPGIKGFETFRLNPAIILGTQPMAPMFNPRLREAMAKFIEMIDESAKANAVSAEVGAKLTEMGFPPIWTGAGEVPFDILSDYFRGTMGMFYDLVQCPEKVAEACEVFVDVQKGNWEYFKTAPLPVKRVFFPLHKGMDGFMSGEHYAELYWKPFQKLLKHLVGMGVTPVIYTEGPYDSRVALIREQLQEMPPSSCIIHFEKGDFAWLKKQFEGIACLSGGMSVYNLEWGTKEQVVNEVKYLIDHCAAGGGYLFNSGAGVENAKRENVEAMFETVETYGRK